MRLPLLAVCAGCALLSLAAAGSAAAPTPDAQTIIHNSVEANQRDFLAATHFNHKECDQLADGSKTFEVIMLYGSPYKRLLAVNGKPLTHAQTLAEDAKEQQERRRRAQESPAAHRARVRKFETGRKRDHELMSQLTQAFTFTLEGEATLNGRRVYQLKATPRSGYQPPNLQTQVLPGMQGELWIDTQTFQWVKVMAEVIHPVSIEGFLAQVEPGTRFELQKAPVTGDVWLPSRFSMKSAAKVLFMFNRNSEEEDTFSDYTPVRQ